MFPRGGGIWDQDPVLMHHFRIIRKFDLEWKDSQSKMNEAQSNVGFNKPQTGGDPAGLGGALNQFIDTLEDEGYDID